MGPLTHIELNELIMSWFGRNVMTVERLKKVTKEPKMITNILLDLLMSILLLCRTIERWWSNLFSRICID